MESNKQDFNFKKMVKEIDKQTYQSQKRLRITLVLFCIFGWIGAVGVFNIVGKNSNLYALTSIISLTVLGGNAIITFQFFVESEILKRAQLVIDQ